MMSTSPIRAGSHPRCLLRVLGALLVLAVHGWCQFAPAQPQERLIGMADSLLIGCQRHGDLHGAVALGRNGEVAYTRGLGLADRERGVANTADTRFLIGSLSKQFTAALILSLAEEGAVDLHRSIASYLPAYAGTGKDRITLHHLLAHRSGIPSRADVRAAARGEPGAVRSLDFEPGSGFAYSNAGYVLLGLVVEAVTGTSYAAALRTRILEPVGLAGEIGYPAAATPVESLATGYVDTWWGLSYRRAPRVHPDEPFAAGALYASPVALVRWTIALHRGDVISDSLLDVMTTPYSPGGYAYGLVVERTVENGEFATITHHGGGINGFAAALRHIQLENGDRFVVAVLDNKQGEGTMEVAESLQRVLVQSTARPASAASAAKKPVRECL